MDANVVVVNNPPSAETNNNNLNSSVDIDNNKPEELGLSNNDGTVNNTSVFSAGAVSDDVGNLGGLDKRLLEAASAGQTDLVLQLLEEEGQQLHLFKDKVSGPTDPFQF